MASRVYSVPAGISLVDALAAGLIAQYGGPPETLASVLVLVPTRRAVRSLREAFLRQSDGKALILPAIRPLGDVDEDDLALAAITAPEVDGDLAPAIAPLRRHLLLARHIRDAGGRFGAVGDEQAAQLAEALAAFIDEADTAEADLDRLDGLVGDDLADHWKTTLEFLKTVTRDWPRDPARQGQLDPARRRRLLIDALVAAWRREPPRTPVIAAGSTGTIKATARLLACVAHLPQGMVVLPGLDQEMSAEAWEQLGPTHPQFALKDVLAELGTTREAVAAWPVPPGSDLPRGNDARRALLSAALLPAEATEAWNTLALDMDGALDGLDIVRCANPREEAEVAALRMRFELETQGRTVALVTRDRALARRVAAELARWDIAVDDSAGTPFAVTPAGAFLRLILRAAASGMAPVPLLGLLKHPLARFGREAVAARAAVRRLERLVLRGPRPAPGIEGLRAALDGARHETREADAVVDALEQAMAPLCALMAAQKAPLRELVAAQIGAAEALARDEEGAALLWKGEDGEAANALAGELLEDAGVMGFVAPGAFPALFDSLIARTTVRPRFGLHPRAFIWGPLEARMQHADCVVLGGLYEGNWPPEAPSDPWMSRPMRSRFGLPSPEQRIGQAAHDFVQAAAADRVLLLYPERAGGAPTVPARWLTRLEALLEARGRGGAPQRQARGWRLWQSRLDRPQVIEPAQQPRPAPPVADRPNRLSVTEIATWLRDPYAIYARRVLELAPLDPLDEDADGASRGEFVHAALEEFVRRHPVTMPAKARDELLEIGRGKMTGAMDRPSVHALWWRRFERIAEWFVAFEAERRGELARVDAEIRGQLAIADTGGRPFTLNAKADRIERTADGRLRIGDYKTGALPTQKDVQSGRAPQLPLEAAIAQAGGFRDIPAAEVAEVAHWHLSGGDPAGLCRTEKGDAPAMAQESLAGLTRLVRLFENDTTPYLDHPGGAPVGPFDAYVDIARTGEWRLGWPDVLPDPELPPESDRRIAPRQGNTLQQAMSDPEMSVWVAASAGTGKTKVLTDRVLRLLLAGTPPARILCLTFTKAAAAEMANRIRHELGLWLALDDDALATDLANLAGVPASAEEMARARTLFAEVLDAPGGLQISTIHGFCQSLLGRFPLEAGVAPHFSLIEDRGQKELLREARELVLGRIAGRDPDGLADALDALAIRAGEGRVAELVDAICAEGHRLERIVARHGTLPRLLAATRRALGLAEDDSAESIVAEACRIDAILARELRGLAEAMRSGNAKDQENAAMLTAWLAAGPEERTMGYEACFRLFLTAAGEPRKSVMTKAAMAAWPEATDLIAREQERHQGVVERLRACETMTRTASLLRLGMAVLETFRRLKDEAAVLDYDDLIERARRLLATPGIAPWVLYKLDGGIDHVLVDEAQDTNPGQWQVVLALVEEFFAGEGEAETPRTIFVVGDEKQSIYSFQGADLEALQQVRERLRAWIDVTPGRWLEAPLDLSYRSVAAVLEVVDGVFADPEAAQGVAFAGLEIVHQPFRTGDAGLVELWPPVLDEAREEADPWLAPIDESLPRDRHSRLAEGMAATIAQLTGPDGPLLESRGGPITPGDIMILVRKRSAVVAALVRELRRLGVPVAGVDRMDLTGQVVVRDLLALGRFCLMPDDDVALASVLKGPLVDFDDDLLRALAHGRPREEGASGDHPPPRSLWACLRERRGENGAFARAHAWLGDLLNLTDRLTPVGFLGHVLTRPAATQDGFSGRKALIRRLGLEANDPLDELIHLAFAFEQEHAPSLEGFVWWLGTGTAEVKREAEAAGETVRIMTVHGAKGLQAPVVFLIDDIGARDGRSGSLLWDEAHGFVLWPAGQEGRDATSAALALVRRRREEEEERRLLYVALTRARDRLYVCASAAKEDKEDEGWYGLVRAGLSPLAAPFAFESAGGGWSGEGLRLTTQQTRAVRPPAAREDAAPTPAPMPDAFRQALPPERPGDRPLSPSRLQGEAPAPPSPLAGDDGAGLRRGRIVHRLLELLPDIAADRRREAARRLIARHAADWPDETAARLADDLLAVLDADEHAALFAPGSTAEVSIVGRLGDTVIAGQVDRLVVTPEAVLIVDYKTGAMPQGGAGATPEAYLRQLAAYRAVLREVYPGRAVRCALLWVDRPEFVPIPDSLLDAREPR